MEKHRRKHFQHPGEGLMRLDVGGALPSGHDDGWKITWIDAKALKWMLKSWNTMAFCTSTSNSLL